MDWLNQVADVDLQKQVKAEQVKGVYQQATMAAVNSWCIGIIVLVLPNPAVSFTTTLLWFVALTFGSLFRLGLVWAFKRATLDIDDYTRWGIFYAVAVFTASIVWASTLFVLTSAEFIEYEAVFMIILVAMCVGASHASTTYPLVGQVYYIPAMACVLVNAILLGGAVFYALALMTVIYSVMMFVVGRDSHQRFAEIQRLQFELAEQKEEAEKANIAKSKFLAAASHDLRQPLHALALFTGVLKAKITKPDVIETVDNIDRSVDALQSLFNGLLDISKLDAGSLTPEPRHIALTHILQPLENEYIIEAKDKGIGLHIENSPAFVYTDPDLLSRIVRNLVSNAIRYTSVGAVTVKCIQQGDHVVLSVQDTGPGIERSHQEDIFDEFVQLHNPERDRNKGLGLGLAIVKRLVNLLGYELTLESKVGQGTCFTLNVPLGEKMAVQAATVADVSASLSIIDGMHIMLIDDEVNIRQGAVSLLEAWGCKAHAFASADACLEYLASGGDRPQIILADYRLQDGKTGVEAINDVIATVGEPIPAAIITGDTAPDRIREAEASGYLLLHKPIQPMQLRAFLTRTVRQMDKRAFS